jgi:prephenate dehydratase
MKKVIIQGIAGSFHDIASRSFFDEEIEVVECPTFKEQFSMMKNDPSLFGMVAIENTVAGSILPNYNLIRESELKVIGEHKMHISQNLVGLKGQKIEDIESVESHPMALRQSEEFIAQYPKIRMVESSDTASSARRIATEKRPNVATICGELAADIYDLEILARNIETNKKNFTRFLVLQNQWSVNKDELRKTADKSSIVFSLPHKEGSLSKVLTILSFYDINLSKIQSLPVLGQEWHYMFYIDLVFDDYVRYKQAVDAILPLTAELKILGEYKKN